LENPSTWKPADLVITNALGKWQKMHDTGAIGFSVGRFIADALRHEGLLDDKSTPTLGWDALRAGLKGES
jgi:hypothetical protein